MCLCSVSLPVVNMIRKRGECLLPYCTVIANITRYESGGKLCEVSTHSQAFLVDQIMHWEWVDSRQHHWKQGWQHQSQCLKFTYRYLQSTSESHHSCTVPVRTRKYVGLCWFTKRALFLFLYVRTYSCLSFLWYSCLIRGKPNHGKFLNFVL